MDIQNMLDRLDELYSQGNLGEAENCLDMWLDEAYQNRRWNVMLTLFNEMEGLYRTTGRADKAADISDNALELIGMLGLSGTVHHATTLQNGATANRVAGNMHKALDMYCQAADIYLSTNSAKSYQMASLYNNISHIYQHFRQHEKALEFLGKALGLIVNSEDCEADIATTKTGMALSHMALGNMTEAEKCMDDAMNYYNSDAAANDGHKGSALSAAGELFWHKKDYVNALLHFEKALDFTLRIFGENDGCRIIRQNIETIKKEMQSNT